MKSVIRLFALLVAVAGLASASLTPAAARNQQKHVSMIASGPITADMPGPEPCALDGDCAALTGSNTAPGR